MVDGHHADLAFVGEMELTNAAWNLDAGRTVEFRICGDAYSRVHPFKKYQQRRNGRMGTRFRIAVADSKTGEMFFHGEVMLAGWKDSSYSGQQITLWLDEEADRHPFAGFNRRKNGAPGDMFAVSMGELDDNDQLVNEARREAVEAAVHGSGDTAPAGPGVGAAGAPGAGAEPRAGAKDRPGAAKAARGGRRFSSQAHLMVTSKMFIRYLEETKPRPNQLWTAERAKMWVKNELKIESLSDLDRNKSAERAFHEKIRKPYARWNEQTPP
jgi:hypothetical protein